MSNILIAGGTGLIGSRLSLLLREKGHTVRHLSRSPDPEATFPAFAWDPLKGTIDPKAMEGIDHVINLAGAGIADSRWTPARKKLIIDSRVEGARTLKQAMQASGQAIQSYISSSAIGYYGDRGDTLLSEESEPGEGFLSESTQQWEKSVEEVAQTGIRTVAIRTGIVLSTQGGAVDRMLKPTRALLSTEGGVLEELFQPARFNLGTYFGDGRQWYSWIHIDDISRIFIYAMEQDLPAGAYNGVAPNPVRNRRFAESLLEALDKKGLVAPVPSFILQMLLGEMTNTVLDSTRVSSQKIEEAGFKFSFPELVPAFQDIFEREI